MTWSGAASRVSAVAGGGLLALLGGLATRYSWQQQRIEREWLTDIAPRLDSIGEVDEVSIVPVVERAVARAALVHNADALQVNLQVLDGVVISHLHADHVRHERADVVVTKTSTVTAPGVAVLPPLPANMFWLGPLTEQVLVVNVRGFGLVLVSGCGHPRIERMLAATERVLDVHSSRTSTRGALEPRQHALDVRRFRTRFRRPLPHAARWRRTRSFRQRRGVPKLVGVAHQRRCTCSKSATWR